MTCTHPLEVVSISFTIKLHLLDGSFSATSSIGTSLTFIRRQRTQPAREGSLEDHVRHPLVWSESTSKWNLLRSGVCGNLID